MGVNVPHGAEMKQQQTADSLVASLRAKRQELRAVHGLTGWVMALEDSFDMAADEIERLERDNAELYRLLEEQTNRALRPPSETLACPHGFNPACCQICAPDEPFVCPDCGTSGTPHDPSCKRLVDSLENFDGDRRGLPAEKTNEPTVDCCQPKTR